MKSKLYVCEIHSEYKGAKWFIMEVYPCADGFRSRICNGRWNTKAEAIEAKDLLERNN